MGKVSLSKKKNGYIKISRKTFSYPYLLFMLIFLVVPLFMILVNAFLADGKLTFNNFISFFTDGTGMESFFSSLLFGLVTTLICLIIGYPVAYILAKNHAGGKILALLFILPMWVNFLLRTLAIKEIFEVLSIPLGQGTLLFGLVYNYLPFMILPLHNILTNIDPSYEEAARDLGCDGADVFLRTTMPLSLPGVLSGITMVFIPAISTYAISDFLSGTNKGLFGDLINAYFGNVDTYGVGSVMALVMLAFVLVSNILLNRFNKDSKGGNLI